MARGLQQKQVETKLLRESTLGRQKSSDRVERCLGGDKRIIDRCGRANDAAQGALLGGFLGGRDLHSETRRRGYALVLYTKYTTDWMPVLLLAFVLPLPLPLPCLPVCCCCGVRCLVGSA